MPEVLRRNAHRRPGRAGLVDHHRRCRLHVVGLRSDQARRHHRGRSEAKVYAAVANGRAFHRQGRVRPPRPHHDLGPAGCRWGCSRVSGPSLSPTGRIDPAPGHRGVHRPDRCQISNQASTSRRRRQEPSRGLTDLAGRCGMTAVVGGHLWMRGRIRKWMAMHLMCSPTNSRRHARQEPTRGSAVRNGGQPVRAVVPVSAQLRKRAQDL